MSKKQHEPEHIIVQLRKVVNTHGHANVRFNTGIVPQVTIDQAQTALAMYSDAMPLVKEQMQLQLAKSYDDFTAVVSGSWEPEIEDTRVKERQLFNTDPIFGLDSEHVNARRRTIKRRT